MRTLRRSLWTLVPMAALVAGCTGGEKRVKPLYNHATGRVLVQMPRPLEDGEILVTQARRGSIGEGQLDCAQLLSTLTPLVDHDEDLRYYGPPVDQALTVAFYGPEWAGEPTQEMLDAVALGTDSIIDVCIMNADGEITEAIEADLFKAWDTATDQGLNGKADDTTHGEVRINSAHEYGVRCVGELGEIPFFEKNADQDYSTYNCLDSTPIPMTVTTGGSVDRPDGVVGACDKPQYIYDLCEQGPRVASRINDQGTRWVLLCRKSEGGLDSSTYNDIAMVGHNPYTGKACFFQNALYVKKDGARIPHPADRERSANLWSGVHGGRGNGIQCTDCHDADAFIHSPWIDGAKNPNGTSVVPKMGEDPEYQIGDNEMAYKIVNGQGQGWRFAKQVTDARVNACTRCHRMGEDGIWARDWLSRLEQTDSAWEGITTDHGRQFENARWMPPSGVTEAGWATSEYAAALDFLQTCASGGVCEVADVPTSPGGAEGNGKLRDPVTLADSTLASRAFGKLNSCGDCHTESSNQRGMRRWAELTTDAENGGCLDGIDGGEAKHAESTKTVRTDEVEQFGPYEVAIGGSFKAQITGSGDADLYVKKHDKVSAASYDCRPFSSTSRETCGVDQFKAHGPGKFYVMVRGKASSSRFTIKVDWTARGDGQKTPKQVIACLRKDPDNATSPFAPQKLGLYTTGAHLGWFADLFRGAYPATDDGNTRDTWVIEYAKFKSLMLMPKGNHAKYLQKDYNEVVEWFSRGLPNLADYVQDGGTPTTCTPGVSSEMTSHIATMATQGWRAVNDARDLSMYGCGGSGGNPRMCLTSETRATSTSYGSQWETGTPGLLRVVRTYNDPTSYWMRTSANGRFVGNGGVTDAGAAITDLQRDVDIPTNASYDPGFFPDNSGFLFQGGGHVCTTSLLTSNPAEITFEEAQCSTAGNVNLYQHMSSSVDGGDHFVINSQFTSDSGGPSSNPDASFAAEAKIKITPLAFDGTRYTEKESVEVPSPFEGDSVLSPSGQLVVSRLAGPEGAQLGYVARRVIATPSGNSYTFDTPEVATYCVTGGKVSVSFDERWMVTHRYTDDRSDIFLIDLANGQERKMTNMKAGQYAMFPHWRSDNWVLFLVKDTGSDKEYAVAGDAALALE